MIYVSRKTDGKLEKEWNRYIPFCLYVSVPFAFVFSSADNKQSPSRDGGCSACFQFGQ